MRVQGRTVSEGQCLESFGVEPTGADWSAPVLLILNPIQPRALSDAPGASYDARVHARDMGRWFCYLHRSGGAWLPRTQFPVALRISNAYL